MSKTLIVYASRYGTTDKAVAILKEELSEAVVCNISKEDWPGLDEFSLIIIGGSIRAGKIQKEIKKFCHKNLSILIKKDLALFIICMYDGEKAEKQFNQAFPEKLRQAARVKKILGGELLLEKLNPLEKFILKKFIGVKESVSLFNPEEIKKLAQIIKG